MAHPSDFLYSFTSWWREMRSTHPLSPHLNEPQDKWLRVPSWSGSCLPFQSFFVRTLYVPLIRSTTAILNVFHPCLLLLSSPDLPDKLFPPFGILLSVHSTPRFHLLLSQYSPLSSQTESLYPQASLDEFRSYPPLYPRLMCLTHTYFR